jgi:hypothetical protein
VLDMPDRATYMRAIDVGSLAIKRHRMSEPVDYGDE